MLSLSNDPDQMSAQKNKRRNRVRTEKRGILQIRSPYKQIIPENYGKYYLFTFFPTFILRAVSNKTQNERKKHVSVCTLSFLRQRYFRLIYDLWILDFNAKNESTTPPTIPKCKLAFCCCNCVDGRGLFAIWADCEPKNVLCFYLVTWDSCALCTIRN